MALTKLTKGRARWQTFKLKVAEAVSRSLYEKLLDQGISVKDFGAKGDGVTDDTAAIQAALSYAYGTSWKVVIPSGVYRVTSSLDVTDRFGGVTIVGQHCSQLPTHGTVLLGETGERAVIDGAGTERLCIQDMRIESGSKNPSKIGILQSRTKTSKYAQFNVFNRLTVNIHSDPSAFNGRGTVGIYNITSEIATYDSVYSLGDTGLFIGNNNLFNVKSYKDLNSGISSCSNFQFLGSCVFDSRNEIGNPVHFLGATQAEGSMYVNGAKSVSRDTYAVRFEGINRGHDLTIFNEFSLRAVWIDNGFNDNKIRIIGAWNKDRYIQMSSGFTGINNNTFELVSSISGSITPPDFWIVSESSDFIKNCTVLAPKAPTKGYVVPTNKSNVINCTFKTNDEVSSECTQIVTRGGKEVDGGLVCQGGTYDTKPIKIGSWYLWMVHSYGTNGDLYVKQGSAPSSETDGTLIGGRSGATGTFQDNQGRTIRVTDGVITAL